MQEPNQQEEFPNRFLVFGLGFVFVFVWIPVISPVGMMSTKAVILNLDTLFPECANVFIYI